MTRTRSWRRHQTQRVIENRLRLVKNMSQEWDDWYNLLLKKRNDLSNRSPYDCGNSRCGTCHFEKIFYRKGRHNENRRAIQEEFKHIA